MRPGEPADREDLVDIWRERFGGEDDLGAWLDDALGDDEETVAFVADEDGTPVGFAVVALLDPEATSGYVGGVYPPAELPERTAVIHALGVAEEHTDGEVGSALTERCIDWGAGRAPMLLAVIWRREDHVDASVLTERYDIQEVARIKGYYRGRREHCPDCGDTCTCDATVHVRPLPE
jgi:ribosomal protein S18 acetylase RimI-like enzyme